MKAPKSEVAADVPERERVLLPALVVVDMQNDFVRQGAPLEVPDARATIPAILRLIAAFRDRARPVMFTRFLSREEENLLWLWSPQCRPETKCCWPDHLRVYADAEAPRGVTDVIDELPVEPGDAIIDKFGYGAFHGTDLDARLRAAGVSSLVIAGTVTQICVEETAREAFHHGYRTVMVRDGVSSFAPDLHAAALKNFAMKYGWVSDADEIASWL